MATQSNVISMSGGKDSTATALLAIERDVPNRSYVFADTGHEHQLTYEYIDYIEDALGIKIDRVKADFRDKVIAKREVVKVKWKKDGVSDEIIARALEVLQPTGIPFLDLCLWKGRFPSTRRRFCSEELKHKPLDAFMDSELAIYDEVMSWQGVRRDESLARKFLDEEEDHPTKQGLVWYRPILDWKAADCFAIAKRHGLEPNPLYKEGMGRVGCMPCIHATKSETMEISMRYPQELERLAEWERMVSQGAKRQCSTFFDARTVQRHLSLPKITPENQHNLTPESHGVAQYVEWSKTARGGRQYDLIKSVEISENEDGAVCKSMYGLCE